ncbi:MAG: hypothetical protein ACOC1Z_04385 [Cyanobacteriota bacterium]
MKTIKSFFLPPYRNFLLVKIRKIRKISWLRKVLGYTSVDPVIVENHPLIIRNHRINYHDFYHLEIAKLERIKIGKDNVSGIHGINSPYFHDEPITEEYDSSLDEARVAIHQWLTHFSIASTLKMLIWIVWFLLNKINPFSVICQHYKSLKFKK